jgi:hypothetical protein
MKKIFLTIMVFTLAILPIACGNNGNQTADEQSFTWWITRTDSYGTFYQYYEENPAVQWLNQQYWDLETGTYNMDGNGTKLNFSYQAPITGSESDNFNTMIATGSYPEIVDLSYSVDSPKDLYEEGILIEITEYVEKYMPDYLAFIDEHPEVKPFVSETDENGDVHYYSLWGFSNIDRPQWDGFAYRRDWLVKYATPTEYVWDWDSSYVETYGHPKYTPLSVAEAENDYTGWKTNPITSFTSNYGDDNTWEDNVIFPSGTDEPLYISDWEWMLETFKTAIEAEGFNANSNAYPVSIYYMGYIESGDLVSSFGGGGPMWYIDQNGDAQFGATGDNFKTYVEAMNNWYEKGWLDSRFDTRNADMFYKINLTGISQGMVGLFQTATGYIGTTIRATASNEDARDDAMVFSCPFPINDVYGDESNKFKEPDTFYGAKKVTTGTGFTDKIEGKDLEALFTMLNWMYTFEGALFSSFGLSKEMYESVTLEPDLYAEYGIDCGYYIEEDEFGQITYVATVPRHLDFSNAVRTLRMPTALILYDSEEVKIESGYSKVVTEAYERWSRYSNTGYILDYDTFFNDEQSSLFAKTRTHINTSLSIEVPKLIKEGLSGWDVYVGKVNKYGPSRVTEIYQDALDSIKE